MFRIAFSLLVHEKPLVILDQIVNILTFNPNSIVVLHFNPNFRNNDCLNHKELIALLENEDRVIVNPHPVNVSIDNIIQGHLSNYHCVENLEFDYFYLIASNELFVCHGAEDFVEKFDYGCFHNKNNDWVYFEKMSSDESLANILCQSSNQGYYLSQVEGSFYSKAIFSSMVGLIEKNFDYKNQKVVYPREEIYFSSITGKMYQNLKRYNGCLCFINWKRGLFVSIKDVKKVIGSDSLFSVKRVDRQIDNYLREYIRRLIDFNSDSTSLKKWKAIIPSNHLNLFQIYFIDCFWNVAYMGRAILVFIKRLFSKRSKRSKK